MRDSAIHDQINHLQAAIAAQEMLRGVLGDEGVAVAVAALHEKLAELAAAAARQASRRRQVTVLFADLVGFTPMAEEMDPEDVRDVMADYFAALNAALDRHGGQVEKYIGDAVVALFGAGRARESDAAEAVRAALAMHANLARLNEQMEVARGLHLEMRCGINTGMVVISSRAGDRARGPTLVGDTVNLAALS